MEKLITFLGSIYKYKPKGCYIEIGIYDKEVSKALTIKRFSTTQECYNYLTTQPPNPKHTYFYRVNPTTQTKGFSKDEAISGGNVLFQDIDFEDLKVPDYEEFEKTILSKFSPRPNIVIYSGRKGYHLYWLLNRFLPVEKWEELQKGWMNYCKKHYCSKIDPKITNSSRYMRLPCFIHPKSNKKTEIVFESYYLEHTPENFKVIKEQKYPEIPIANIKETNIPEQKIKDIINIIAPHWREGNRYGLAMGLSGFLRKRGISFEETKNIITTICIAQKDEELQHRLNNIKDTYNKSLKEIAGTSWLSDMLTEEKLHELKSLFNSDISIEWIISEDPFKLIDLHKNKSITLEDIFYYAVGQKLINVKYKDEEQSIENIKKIEYNQTNLVRFLNRIFTPYFTFLDTEDTYYYNKNTGVYELLEDAKITNFVYCLLPIKLSKMEINNNINYFFKTYELQDRSDIESKIAKNKICLLNGVLNLKNFELEPFSKDNFFFSKIPVNYNSNAKCEKIESFLKDVLPEEKDRLSYYELCGEILVNSNFLNKLHIFVGAGETGKSTAIDLLTAFVSEKNTIEAQIIDLAIDRHYIRSKLINKKLCCYADISSKELNDMAFIKSITGEDKVNARNIYGHPFFFRYSGSLVFSANEPPQIEEDNSAVWRRINLTAFNQKIPKEQKIIKEILLKNLTQNEELSGLLNKSLEGLKRLYDNGKYSNEKSLEETRKFYLNLSNTIFQYVEEYINTEVDYNSYEKCEEIYTQYCLYCTSKRKIPISDKKFSKFFISYTNSIKTVIKVLNKSIKVYIGIVIRKKVTDVTDVTDNLQKSYRKKQIYKKLSEKIGNIGNIGRKNINNTENTDKSVQFPQEMKGSDKKMLDRQDQLLLVKELIKNLKKEDKNNIEHIREKWGDLGGVYPELYDIDIFIGKLKQEGVVFEPKCGIIDIV